LVLIAFGIIGLIVFVLLVAAALAYQGRALVKGGVAVVAWLAISLPLFTLFYLLLFGLGFTGSITVAFVVGWIAVTFAYGYVGSTR
jgi:hypothetical protein